MCIAMQVKVGGEGLYFCPYCMAMWHGCTETSHRVEYLWDELEYRAIARLQCPKFVTELASIFLQEWHAVPVANFEKLEYNLLHNVTAVIAAKGDNTSY
ncbi:hypothetical protein TNIN_499641 [Trichonephila inaurata madagascariensis]|uniref:Uncharacterized protein n=1 Tax=Trichonephila inaurata madagascariensis TaxID=2747483 RepID=A0A8X6IMQ3_9ARAC|nr:hypothetical protein TNIN_499641 [Trichonephila inaurata madagascariensis]